MSDAKSGSTRLNRRRDVWASGGVAPTAEQANDLIARGYRALVIGFDWSLLQRGIASVIDGIKR